MNLSMFFHEFLAILVVCTLTYDFMKQAHPKINFG